MRAEPEGGMDGGVIELSGEMRACAAAELRAQLIAALEAGDLRISATELTGADCAIMQVLVAACRTADRLDRNLQIDGVEDGALGAGLDRLAIVLPVQGRASDGL